MHQITEVTDIQNEHLLLSSLNTSKTLQKIEQDVDFGFQWLKTCSFHYWGKEENVFSLSNTFFSLRVQSLAVALTLTEDTLNMQGAKEEVWK